jgi:hypothetical protein
LPHSAAHRPSEEIGRTDAAQYGSVAWRYPPVSLRLSFFGDASKECVKQNKRPNHMRAVTGRYRFTLSLVPSTATPMTSLLHSGVGARLAFARAPTPTYPQLPPEMQATSICRPSLMTRQTLSVFANVHRRIGAEPASSGELVLLNSSEIQRSRRQRAAPKEVRPWPWSNTGPPRRSHDDCYPANN